MSAASSVVGVEAGIDHGTVRGYRQHKYRGVPHTTECGCLDAYRADQADERADKRRATAEQKAWNGGLIGERTAPLAQPVPARCTDPECGTPAAGQELPDGWEGATVDGVRRRYCRAWCATYAQALADIRAIPSPERAR